MMPKISVIIPVYNAEKYLKRCLESLINSLVDELEVEIILVNDGSSDTSLDICRDFKTKYDYIKVFDQNNQGPSAARNLGLQNATGEWIVFVDSDDYVEKNYFERIITEINTHTDIDIFVFNYYKTTDSKCTEHKVFNKFNQVFNHINILEILKNTNDFKYLLFPVNKVYKGELIRKYGFFDNEIRFGEDALFNLRLFFYAQKLIFIDKALYNYYENPSSFTSQKYKPNLIENMENHFSKKLEFYNSKPELNKDFYFRDIARVNLEKTFYAFLGNIIAKEGGDFISDLKEIRKTKLIEFGFEHYKLYNIKVFKQRLTLWMLKNRMYYILKLMYKK